VKFAEANLNDLGGGDLQDILAGIDVCIDRGLADPDRLGIGGWSYGGYMTAWAITQTDRFAAAVAGASITNWYSFHGGTNIPGFASQYVDGPSDELDSSYARTSPLFFSKNTQTPTLFVHGENDDCCPVGQAYEMTRALRMRDVTVECAVYPREGHGLVEREHRRDLGERAVGWFARYLGVS
jgi:dipeptidyl aminopeptidase/acylaminoacyl peptidase